MSIHVFAMFKRRPGMTQAEFREYWYARRIASTHPHARRRVLTLARRRRRGTNHARIFTSVPAVKAHIVRYSQVPLSHTLAPASGSQR